jgi:hypothetical protein
MPPADTPGHTPLQIFSYKSGCDYSSAQHEADSTTDRIINPMRFGSLCYEVN